jgi:hypothetical protein
MAASYPSSAKSFTTKATDETIAASHVNDLQDEVTAVEQAMLTSGLAHNVFPSGSRTLGTSSALWEKVYGTAVIVGAETTSGARLEVDGGVLVGREGDDSADVPARFLTVNVTGGQVAFPATQAASADANTLDDYEEGTYTGTLTGVSGSVTTTVRYTKIGNQITLNIDDMSGTSNATTKTLTGMPAALLPARIKRAVAFTGDNGGSAVASMAILRTTGTIELYPNAAAGNWTASGTAEVLAFQMAYTLA